MDRQSATSLRIKRKQLEAASHLIARQATYQAAMLLHQDTVQALLWADEVSAQIGEGNNNNWVFQTNVSYTHNDIHIYTLEEVEMD